MSIPSPGVMNVPPPNLIKGIECFQNTPPTFRKEGKVSLSAGETRGSMRDSTRSRNGDAKRSTVEFSRPRYGRDEENLKPFKRISQGFDDSGFAAPEDFDGNAGFLRKKKLMEMVDTTQIVQDEVKKDKHTRASYTEHLIFERKHYFRTKDGRMLMPRPVECVNPSNERISLCGELTELRQLRRNGTGSGWNIQMVFSREGAMMAAVCFPPNDEPEGKPFHGKLKRLEGTTFYRLIKLENPEGLQ